MSDRKRLFPSTWQLHGKKLVSWEFAVDGKLNEYRSDNYSHKIGSYIYVAQKHKLIVMTIKGTRIYDVECVSEESLKLKVGTKIIELHRKQ